MAVVKGVRVAAKERVREEKEAMLVLVVPRAMAQPLLPEVEVIKAMARRHLQVVS